MDFRVEEALLVNEGGVQCVPLVFARAVGPGDVEVTASTFLNEARVARLDPVRAAQRGPGLVAFVLEDPMDTRWFQPGDIVRLERR